MSNTIFTLNDLVTCRPKTLARKMHNYLHYETETGDADPSVVYLKNLTAIRKGYQWADQYLQDNHKEINPLDYHDDVLRIYSRRTWTTAMVDSLLEMRNFLLPHEWLALWKSFYKISLHFLLEKFGNPNHPQIEMLERMNQQLTREDRLALRKAERAKNHAAKLAHKQAKLRKQMGLPSLN